MSAQQPDPAGRLRDELDPSVLPRQLRALERVADRVLRERPLPAPDFRGRLDTRVRELAVGLEGDDRWRLIALACLASGVVLLVVAAILATAG